MRRKWVLVAAGLFFALGVAVLATLSTLDRGPAVAARQPPERAGPGPAVYPSQGDEVRVLAGYSGPKYIDSSGRTWLPDRWSTGGRPFSQPDRRILRTLDQKLYHSGRMGDFRYDIPLPPGVYELHLHFAETQYGGTTTLESGVEGFRRFHVSVNGKILLDDFDIIASAGAPNTADERILKDVGPAEDGFLRLEFTSYHGAALVNAVEILPASPGRIRPIRILAGSQVYVDQRERFWGPDRYFLGGRVSRPSAPVETAEPADDAGLYGNARWGHFSYAIPVAEGRYSLVLRFAEPTFGIGGLEGPGRRLFDVYCNGVVLLKNFDIFKEAGGANRGVVRTFRGLEPNALGKLLLWFVPVRNYANVYAIEVVPD